MTALDIPTITDFATGAALSIANQMAPGPWATHEQKVTDPLWLGAYSSARRAYLDKHAQISWTGQWEMQDLYDAGFYAAIEVRDAHQGVAP